MNDPTIQNLFDLSGRVALISGATGWLGSAMARALAEAGASVIVASRDRDNGAAAAASLPCADGTQHHCVVMDQLDDDSIERGFADAVSLAGGVDILINNGNAADSHDLTDVTAEQFNRVMRNVTGYFLLSRLLRDHLVGRGASGSIVNIGSMYGLVGSYPDTYEGICPASPASYHTLKGGIIQLTRHLAVYWARDGVRVNCLSPGPFPTQKAPPEMVERLKTKSPMNRMGLPHEVKGALLLLASDAGSYITGQNLTVDGGWTAW
ncbi:3-oxoacyl-[acyl-carrier-protein] reductase FabG [Rosistilla ulvae]|uniref:3-oxoacyl-[acyl-carrier-protein] reductase FabG n=1 Tax=Rosistilla ulvae TaxID=1930277 RepID=A0A517M2M9_9BACT|nr:SDR family oxidoreductase [Rosistilla ulvae]QDS89126.1 3-oxoacyl-[acyl-carrier-protein] reductase FabG [Rosistilla ulvae]